MNKILFKVLNKKRPSSLDVIEIKNMNVRLYNKDR